MEVLVIGSGPAGLVLGATLGARGHHVTSVDRDPGPTPTGWRRRGVMQFEHAHAFRPQVGSLLRAEWPAAYDEWLALGADPLVDEDGPVTAVDVGMLSRRSTLERALRTAASAHRHLALRTGHVDRLLIEEGRVRGAVVDGVPVRADLVVDASGRSSRVGRPHRTDRAPARLDGDCGLAYIDRTYRLRPGAEPGPMNSPLGYIDEFDGYQCLVFLHERGRFSVVLIRPTADAALAALRLLPAYEAACAAIPVLAEWTDPARALPTSEVLVGGALRNVYRSQSLISGLVTVGDAVATTTPTRGRGVAMALHADRGTAAAAGRGRRPTHGRPPLRGLV